MNSIIICKLPGEEDGWLKHDKIYTPYILTSSPAQYPWTCRRCGEIGRDFRTKEK